MTGSGVRYGGVTAVEGLSLTVEPGKITGLIGPNGAGKTSAIDAISGFVTPAEGTLSLDGKTSTGSSAARRVRAPASAARSSRWSCSRT